MPTLSTKPGPEVGVEEEEECSFPCWKTLPDHILLHIFSFLGASALAKAGLICKGWLRVAFDELLWKDLFYRHWGISRSIPMAPGKYSWVQEYKRLLYHTPSVESEVLKQHADQVLHVSFSHNGKMFATCSKDGFIRVWDATYPTSIKYKADMRKFTWKYTQFSQFNSIDTLLLVSGHFCSLSTSGEIAVFSLEGEFVMQCRVMNKPYDVFGTWYNDFYLLSGNLHWTGHLNSCSAIWLNKAYQETMSEEESVVMRLFKFANINASSIRTIMIADCLNDENQVPSKEDVSLPDENDADTADAKLALIDDFLANQEGEDMDEDDDELNEEIEGKEALNTPKKDTKATQSGRTLQSIQVFENGEFKTKFLEVDADEPNNKLNGTIEYSSDYRLAEGPKKLTKRGILGDTSGSELSANSNQSGSEISSVNGSSDIFDHSYSSLDIDIGAKSSRSDLEDSQPENQCLFVKRNAQNQSRPSETEHVHFELSDILDEKLDSPGLVSVSSQNITDNQSVDSGTSQVSVGTQSDYENEAVQADISSASDTATIDSREFMPERLSELSCQPSSSYTQSPKRALHGQQQRQGEIKREPSTCEYESKSEHFCTNSGSNDSLELPEKTPRLAFCCVDYKKQKKVVPLKNKHDDKHGFSRVEGHAKNLRSRTCLGGQPSVEIFENQAHSENQRENCASDDATGKPAVAQSRSCLGRQSMETDMQPNGEAVIGQHKGYSRICAGKSENQSNSDVSVDCVPGRVQTKLCAELGSNSEDSLEYRSASDIDMKSKCKPVRNPPCSVHAECHSVLQSSNKSSLTVNNSDSVPRLRYKTKRTKKGKSRKICDKYLIFTKGSETYTPHQIGIKRIKPLKAFNEDGSRLLPNVSENVHQPNQGEDVYDEVDYLIDMHGHIIGMTLSPDHRYLYVNSRPWPKSYFIENPLYPPPIAQEIDIHVIDLLQMREVGTMHRAHKAYTSNDECFFIFLDVCEEYVASGAEDKHGYLWDRHYGLCLHKYPHTDVVNSVAFNPTDPEVLVTVSDDFSIKIWRSLSREKEVVNAFNKEHSIRVKHVQALMSETSEYDENVSGGGEKT